MGRQPTALRAFAGNQPFTPVIETMRGLWMGHTSTGAAVGHEAWLAVAYCAGILVLDFHSPLRGAAVGTKTGSPPAVGGVRVGGG